MAKTRLNADKTIPGPAETNAHSPTQRSALTGGYLPKLYNGHNKTSSPWLQWITARPFNRGGWRPVPSLAQRTVTFQAC